MNFYNFSPNDVLNAVESLGFLCTGRYLQLNSYENRVYDIFLENGQEYSNLIIKIYRPQRWSKDALNEEHQFLDDLTSNGFPAIAPLKFNDKTIFEYKDLFFSVYKKGLGRMATELNVEDFKKIGRNLALLHNTGQQRETNHRPYLHPEKYGWPSLDLIEPIIPIELFKRFETTCIKIFDFLEDELDVDSFIRIHGDCHKGNLLKKVDPETGSNPFFFVDFDDFCMGPPVQDFWMLLSGPLEENLHELDAMIEGYNELRHFDKNEVRLIEALKALRIVHYDAWIAKRWKVDDSFKAIFPQFHDYNYWAQEVEYLEAIAWGLPE